MWRTWFISFELTQTLWQLKQILASVRGFEAFGGFGMVFAKSKVDNEEKDCLEVSESEWEELQWKVWTCAVIEKIS